MEDSASATPGSASVTSCKAATDASASFSSDESEGDDDEVNDVDDDDEDVDDVDYQEKQHSQATNALHLYDFSSGLAEAQRVQWHTVCTEFLYVKASSSHSPDNTSIGSWHLDQSARTGSSCFDDGPAVPSAKRMRMSAAAEDFSQSSPDSSSPPPVLRPTVAPVLSSVCDCVHAHLGGGCYDAANCPCKENHDPRPYHMHFVSRRWLGMQKRNSQQHS